MKGPFNAVATNAKQNSKQNQLLAALPDTDFQRLLPALERVSLPLGQVLYETGGNQPHVYFPTESIVSLL